MRRGIIEICTVDPECEAMHTETYLFSDMARMSGADLDLRYSWGWRLMSSRVTTCVIWPWSPRKLFWWTISGFMLNLDNMLNYYSFRMSMPLVGRIRMFERCEREDTKKPEEDVTEDIKVTWAMKGNSVGGCTNSVCVVSDFDCVVVVNLFLMR